MVLRRQNVSPAANLLRNSRLFSLPNPLPRPDVATSLGGIQQKASDSATLPYPTHQAIATTKSSLARGDWGLKRPIPSRSRIVQTSSPVIRVTQLDSIEHITDYDSAADHVRTREKFEQLDIPMMRGMHKMRDQGVNQWKVTGAFEYRSDITSYDNDDGLDDAGAILKNIKTAMRDNLQAREQARAAKKQKQDAPEVLFKPHVLPEPDAERHKIRRWKYEGPWLPGMSSEEFTHFITKQLDSRKEEFHQLLIQYIKNEIYTIRQSNWNKANKLPLDEKEAEKVSRALQKEWSIFPQEEIDNKIKELRKEAAEDPLRSRIFQRLVAPFLRISNLKAKDTTYAADNKKNEGRQMFDDSSVPLSTHPSAGLGYLRSTSYMMNHPLLGPQENPTPVTARVLQPRVLPNKNEKHARLGVAGFVTNDPQKYVDNSRTLTNRGTDRFDFETPGGAKLEVTPEFASVDTDARIHISVDRASGSSVLVKRGELRDLPPTPAARQNQENSSALLGLLAAGTTTSRSATTLGPDSAEARSMERLMQDSEKANPRPPRNIVRQVFSDGKP